MNIDNELAGLKRKIEAKKREAAVSEGKIESYMKELKKMGFDSVEQAEEASIQLSKEVRQEMEEIEKRLNYLKEEYGRITGNI
jgi:phosphosulfolactate synthase (CoM biosynthesis protein A)